MDYFELTAALVGLVSIVLQIRQSLWYWPVSILMTILYMVVFFEYTLYAEMLLQVYYFSMCLYGWRCGQAGAHAAAEKKTLPVSRIAPGKWLGVMASTVLLFLVLGAFMHCFTNSDVPWIDSLATALSFVATWMLARKKIENWLFWIVADVLSIGLYWYKAMYPTLALFIVLVVLAFVGYFRWRKDLVGEVAG